MALTPFEQQLLEQADAIRARESGGGVGTAITGPGTGETPLEDQLDFYKQYGTSYDVARVQAQIDGEDAPDSTAVNPIDTLRAGGAPVPPHTIRDAATGNPLAAPPEDTVDDEDEDVFVVSREGVEDTASYEDEEAWSYKDLQAELKGRSLPASGTRDDLVARLRDNDQRAQ